MSAAALSAATLSAATLSAAAFAAASLVAAVAAAAAAASAAALSAVAVALAELYSEIIGGAAAAEVAADVGGTAELIAPEDRWRVLCTPTVDALVEDYAGKELSHTPSHDARLAMVNGKAFFEKNRRCLSSESLEAPVESRIAREG